MKAAPPPEHFDVFARFCVGNLPDSFRERKIILACLLKSLPKGYDQRPAISELIYLLRSHERAQAKFSFNPNHNRQRHEQREAQYNGGLN